MKSKTYKQVFAGMAIEAHFVCQILMEHGIPSFTEADPLSQVFPLFVASGELRPIRIYVDNDNYQPALNWIRIYTKARSGTGGNEKENELAAQSGF